METIDNSMDGIAVIGLACRFPGANNWREFWRNLCEGKESVSRFSAEELRAAGVKDELINNPNYVPVRGIVEGAEEFDAAFFGYSPKEAVTMDPQHRIFLETSWQAFEDSGYDPSIYKGTIGVMASVGFNTYLLLHQEVNPSFIRAESGVDPMLGTDKDFLATKVSYKMNLRGPSFTIQAACSSSLVAVHQACQSLLAGECDMCLAGGITIRVPQTSGYLYQEGSISSPDGHCRPFDVNAHGTFGGNGVGVVVLKRLQDAVEDNDHIYAILRGSALTNDGSDKVGYAAPSVSGQSTAIKMALDLSGVDPATIGMIEAHGSGTRVGDPIEIEALKKAFNVTDKKEYCAIGSVKSNIGHLDSAAGVAGLIKTVLSVYHGLIPPTVNFKEVNLACELPGSPFFVNTELRSWKVTDSARRAGVSSFGMGGTNAHVIVEEMKGDRKPYKENKPELTILPISARTPTSLDKTTAQLKMFVESQPDLQMSDVCGTLQIGRKGFEHRRYVIAKNLVDAFENIDKKNKKLSNTVYCGKNEPSLTFMFSGQGSQYIEMGRSLMDRFPIFKKTMEKCCEIVKQVSGLDLWNIIYKQDDDPQQLISTHVAQPALFSIEYAMATLLLHLGVKPNALIGHSLGEYVAACLSGVFSLEDALSIVCQRGRLMKEMQPGAMLQVNASGSVVQNLLIPEIEISCLNTPDATVVSGSFDAINRFKSIAEQNSIKCQELKTSHAFHSYMMEPMLVEFKRVFAGKQLNKPAIPIISNVTGKWLTEEQAKDPFYWMEHLRKTVNFLGGVEWLLREPNRVFCEVGPGSTLCSFVKMISASVKSENLIINTLSSFKDAATEGVLPTLKAVAELWAYGAKVNWVEFNRTKVNRIPLPVYCFDRKRYWIDTSKLLSGASSSDSKASDWNCLGWVQHHYASSAVSSDQKSLFMISDCKDSIIGIKEMLAKNGVIVQEYINSEEIVSDSNKTFYGSLSSGEKVQDVFTQYLKKNSNTQGVILVLDIGAFLERLNPEYIQNLLNIISFLSSELQQRQTAGQSIKIVFKSNYFNPLGCSTDLDAIKESDSARSILGTEKNGPKFGNFSESIEVVALAFFSRLFEKACNNSYQMLILEDFTSINSPLITHLLVDSKPDSKSVVFVNNRGLVFKREWIPFYDAANENCISNKNIWIIGSNKEYITSMSTVFRKQGCNKLYISFKGNGNEISEEDIPAESNIQINYFENVTDLMSINLEIDQLYICQDFLQSNQQEIENSFISMVIAVAEYYSSIAKIAENRGIKSVTSVVVGCSESTYYNNYSHCVAMSVIQSVTPFFSNGYVHTVVEVPASGHNSAIGPSDKLSGLSSFGGLYSWAGRENINQNAVWSSDENEADMGKAVSNESENLRRYERPELSTPYAAPITERQKRIAKVWEEMFQIDRVGIHDNFFDLGGDSVLSLKLVASLEKEFQISLPLSAVLISPTVADLANTVEEYRLSSLEERPPAPLIKIQTEGDNPLFFCVHPAGGIIHCYIELSRILGKNQPFYALQHPGIDGKASPYGAFDKMAELYVNAIRELQPKGPYFLGGWSFGGTGAFEMAVQLREMGEEVAFLAMFDSPGPSSLYKLKERPEFEFAGMLHFLSQAMGNMFGKAIEVSVNELRQIPPEQQLDYVLSRTVSVTGDSDMEGARAALERILDIFEVTDKGEKQYVPKTLDRDIHMYRVQSLDEYEFTGYKDHPQILNPTFGWDEVCSKNVIVRKVSGTHISMMSKPYIVEIAALFNADLSAAISKTRGH